MRVLFLQFEAEAGPGHIGKGLHTRGVCCEVIRLYAGDPIPALAEYDALIPLGGAMNAEDDERYPYLPAVVEAIRAAHRRQMLTVGVCLGGQLVARSLGARVWRKPVKEIGFFPIELTDAGKNDPLFEHLPDSPVAFQWHEDAFDLPEGALLLADSPRDTLQAFRHGRTYGLQFHPEVGAESIAAWSRWSEAGLASASEPTSAELLARRAREVEATFVAQTEQICANLVSMLQGDGNALSSVD